jgi:hypothetical protein
MNTYTLIVKNKRSYDRIRSFVESEGAQLLTPRQFEIINSIKKAIRDVKAIERENVEKSE